MALFALTISLTILFYSGGSVVRSLQNFVADNVFEKLQLKEVTTARNDNSTFHLKNAKRSCLINDDWPMRIQETNPYVKAPVFIGNYPYANKFTWDLPEDQPTACPHRYNAWWPGTGHNLLPNCPWTYKVLHLGSEYYPSRVLEATCLCAQCIDNTTRKCSPYQERIYVLTLAECRNGYHEMDSRWKTITTSCRCV